MKIAIIGNGQLSKNYGKSIDKNDIVIRFNKAKIEGYEKQVGSKIDILSIVGETGLSYNAAGRSLNRDMLYNVQRIFISGLKRNKNYEKLLDKISGSAKVYRYINYGCYIDICKKIDKGFELIKYPSTGINTLCFCLYKYHILADNKNKLNLYGFDCLKTGHYFDNEKRNNNCHALEIEKKLIEYLKQFKNIKFYN